ncbi:GDSL-like Lipase/Acylhydrolase family protein [Spirosomataceae bacterium TFI 002]|nr:GDSL-like Lipase/Acylhydrolase family protein [Spirosomataceae bacterium TFI 002]
MKALGPKCYRTMYEDFLEEVTALKLNKENEIRKEQVIFYGSSSFRLWETVQVDLSGIDIINLAFGGSNIGACEFYLDFIFENANPSHIVFYCGDNDCIDGFVVEKVVNDFISFFEKVRVKYTNTPFTFVSIKPSPSKAHLLDQIQEVNSRIKTYLSENSDTSFLDVHTEMLNSKGTVRDELYVEDKLHLNKEGYALWTQLFRKYFEL